MPSVDIGPTNTVPFIGLSASVAHAAHIAGAVRVANVLSQNIRWLWPGRIPLGRITLLVSDPGVGKSVLALDIAARVSSGAPWPDEARLVAPAANDEAAAQDLAASADGRLVGFHDPSFDRTGSVVILNAEDDPADTIRPRLEAHGADCNRVFVISAIPADDPQGVPRAFALNRDLARLANLIDALPDCRLVIIDPISAYLGGTNEHANADVRTLLAALSAMAREREIAVLIISHLRKKEGAAIYRTMGSLAFVAAARAAWIVCKDESDPNKRFLLPLKNNLAPGAGGLSYIIERAPIGRAPVIRWLPDPVNSTAKSLLGSARSRGRPDDERQFATEWLQERLAKRPRPASDIRKEADVNGISYGTLRRAFRTLGATAVRESPLPYARWMWKLPGTDAQKSGEEYCASVDILDEFADLFKAWTPSTTTKSDAP
jgi:hypothetical protein